MKNKYQTIAQLEEDAKESNKSVTVVLLAGFSDAPSYYQTQKDGVCFKQLAPIAGHLVFNGLLLHVDEVYAMGSPGTIKMLKSGRVYSLPRDIDGETLPGYYLRTCAQSGAEPSQVGDFVKLVEAAPTTDSKMPAQPFVPKLTGNPLVDWPLIVECFVRPQHYWPTQPEQVAQGVVTGTGESVPGPQETKVVEEDKTAEEITAAQSK